MEESIIQHGLMDFWYPEGQPVEDLIEEIGDTSAEIAGDIEDTIDL
jgi:hypothetical protein